MTNIPKGYKQTEVGVIPEDWEVKKLGDCCRKITDGTHDTPKPIDNGIPFLTAIHVKDNFIDFDNCYFLPQNIHETIYKRCNPEKGDVLMVNIGAGVATTALVSVDYEFSLKNVALLKPDNASLIGSYLNYYQALSKTRITNSISTGGAQPFLSLKQISGLLIALPTKAEQTAIAAALSDADALTTQLEKLIAKKRNIKQGAMQELLRPKNGWEVKRLGEITLSVASGKSNTQSKEGKYPIYGSTGIIGWRNVYDYEGNKILIARVGANAGTVNKVSGKYCVSDNTLMVSLQSNIDIDFIFFKLINCQLNRLVFGSGQPLITGGQLKNLEFSLPSKKEQTRIAQILSDMDAEIEVLEQKLDKYRMIKQGMMQELLTGKTRLV